MKEINEKMQMKIFDLLEGNLSASEANNLRAQIEADPLLKREFDLMRQTYLIANEEDVFMDKALLYKRGGMAVVFKPWHRYAAAVVILLCAGSIWYFNTGIKPTHTAIAIENPTPLEEQKTTGPDKPETRNTGNITPAESHTVSVSSKRTYPTAPKPITTDTFHNVPQFEIPQPNKMLPEPDPEFHAIAASGTDSGQTAQIQNLPVPYAKKRTLTYKLLNNTRAMLANLQLPQVKFSTEKNEDKTLPKVKMTISTLHTDVIATLID